MTQTTVKNAMHWIIRSNADLIIIIESLTFYLDTKSKNEKALFSFGFEWPDRDREISKLSLKEIEELIDLLEDRFVVKVLGLPQSLKFKLYETLMMESGT